MKIIHQIWFQGEKNIPEKYQPYIESVKKHNKEFIYILWDDQSLQELAKKYSNECYDVYMNYTIMHQKIDLGRYLALYFYGGISIDMDIYCNINLSTIYEKINKKYEIVVSELLPTSLFYYLYNGSTTIINNAVIISLQSKSIILQDLINKILKKTCNKDESSFFCIQNTTGPLLFNEIILKHENVLILEHRVLETSCMDTLQDCLGNNKPSLYHIYDNSWMPKYQSIFFKYYVIYNKLYILDILIILLIIICIRRIIF
jgi:mannosyltransferase OCH1-like enzyme